MKCKVCGAESGKYPLCRSCNVKKEQGQIIKCGICGQWHYANSPCPQPAQDANAQYLYESRKALISKTEQPFYVAIKSSLPGGYHVFPQMNLAAFVNKTDNSAYHNELFRNVDFLITDSEYAPKIVVEINDISHLSDDRRKRDQKVKNILGEAGIPVFTLWTSYGVNPEYIQRKIIEILNTPVVRQHNFTKQPVAENVPLTSGPQPVAENFPLTSSLQPVPAPAPQKKQGCYIATCVYGSYDCPQVCTLRRYRDIHLSATRLGRLFIKLYYAVSPTVVKHADRFPAFHKFWKNILDKKVKRLNADGYSGSPYKDKNS